VLREDAARAIELVESEVALAGQELRLEDDVHQKAAEGGVAVLAHEQKPLDHLQEPVDVVVLVGFLQELVDLLDGVVGIGVGLFLLLGRQESPQPLELSQERCVVLLQGDGLGIQPGEDGGAAATRVVFPRQG
jgi:hypothetical protein